eukprot:TRINITY_DN19424_c0_g1_i1.p1 TRINITY_DN19424_c0_g1~~TRINITY_DN19424_c0_g1_i1.p1  ORF type:complete len:252 (-),score=64.23 TRINITY_DN19424_c0_g1_i1:78-833(-)
MLYAKLARLERMLHGRSDKFRPGVVLEDGLDGFSELHMGTVQGDLKSMAELLVMVPSLVHLEDSQGLTPLHWAALLDNGEAVKLLCEHGGHPDAHGALTPLHLAALMGNPKAIGALGECGAEHSRVVVELGLDAVQLSLQSGQIDAVKAMMELRAAGTGMEEDLAVEMQLLRSFSVITPEEYPGYSFCSMLNAVENLAHFEPVNWGDSDGGDVSSSVVESDSDMEVPIRSSYDSLQPSAQYHKTEQIRASI